MGPPRLVWLSWWGNCFFVVLEARYTLRLMALGGCCFSSKRPSRVWDQDLEVAGTDSWRNKTEKSFQDEGWFLCVSGFINIWLLDLLALVSAHSVKVSNSNNENPKLLTFCLSQIVSLCHPLCNMHHSMIPGNFNWAMKKKNLSSILRFPHD